MIPCALALTACEKKVLAVATKPPAELLACAEEPPPPDIPAYEWDRILQAPTVALAVEMMRKIAGARDVPTLDYILAMRAAYGDCKSKVAGSRAWADRMPD